MKKLMGTVFGFFCVLTALTDVANASSMKFTGKLDPQLKLTVVTSYQARAMIPGCWGLDGNGKSFWKDAAVQVDADRNYRVEVSLSEKPLSPCRYRPRFVQIFLQEVGDASQPAWPTLHAYLNGVGEQTVDLAEVKDLSCMLETEPMPKREIVCDLNGNRDFKLVRADVFSKAYSEGRKSIEYSIDFHRLPQ